MIDDIESPGMVRYIAQLRDMGLAWEKITRKIETKFGIKTTAKTVQNIYKRFERSRKQLIASSPEMKKLIQRDLYYALERFDTLEDEVQEVLTAMKDKVDKNHKDYKIMLECVEKIKSLVEDKISLVRKMEPKKQITKAPSQLHITQNIVNSLEELKAQGLITINKPPETADTNVVDMEVPSNGERDNKKSNQERSKGPDRSEHDTGRIPSNEGGSGQGGSKDGDITGANPDPVGPSTRSGDDSGAPIVTVSATTPTGMDPKVRAAAKAAADREKAKGEEG